MRDCFSDTARRILFSVSNTGTWLSVTRGCMQYISTHMQTWRYIVALAMSIVFGLHAKLVFYSCNAPTTKQQMRYQVVSMDDIIERNVYAKNCKSRKYRTVYTCSDMYAPIMVILFANVEICPLSNKCPICSHRLTEKINSDILVYLANKQLP